MNMPENALPAPGLAKPTPKPPKHYEIDRKDRLSLALTLLLCFVTVDGIFWHGPAAGVAASVALCYAILLPYLGFASLRRRENQVLLLTNLLLAATFVLGSNEYFRVWNFMALLVLLPVHAFSLSGSALLPWHRPAMLWERLKLLCGGLFCNLGAFLSALSPKSGPRKSNHLALLAGGGLALALVALLLPILSSADALFAAATAELRLFIDVHFTETLCKFLLALVLLPFLFGLLHRLRYPAPPKIPALSCSHLVDASLFLVLLLALDALYLAFLAVQSAGLFGGAAYLSSRGLSYAAWARSGFFQMTGVTVVNLSALLAALLLSRRVGKSWQALRLAAALLLAESLALLASAAWRMTLYVSAYGLSFKRVMTYWGMAMMLLFLLLAAWKLCRPDASFCRMAFPIALAGWLVINCVPMDFLVAKDTVDRYLSGSSETVSIHYLLYTLSFDSLSQLRRLDGTLHPAECDSSPGYWLPEETLSSALANRQSFAKTQCTQWQTWSLSAYLA